MNFKYIYEIKNNSFLHSSLHFRLKFTKPTPLDIDECLIDISKKLKNLKFLEPVIYTDEKNLNINKELEYNIVVLYLINKEYTKCIDQLNKIYFIHDYFLENKLGPEKLYYFLRDYIDIINVEQREILDDQN